MPRFLYGPVTPDFAGEHLGRFRARGDCLAFGPGGDVDLLVGPAEPWATVRTHLPAGWTPDFVALHLAAYLPVPAGLWSAPIPLVGLAGDSNLLWHSFRHRLKCCELLLADAAGAEALARQGLRHVHQA